ncbi:inclusion body family protein [Chitinophaga filiformis]|uniref:Inclusion body family protein n=1 Tax=Chitinophaga filiformis TaxID=104663 RepID=A0ABY4I9F6_CHIFI|nr:inclusion body family protein [Chitinophaga filiformis]UPK72507.1 inclusion body family protein [Chitinophaga filiformis]
MSSTAQVPSPSRSKTSQKNEGNTVNVLTIVDTEAIKAVYPRNPNASKDNPTGLNHHEGITMLCPASNYVGNINQDPANLEFKANVGDWISFRATTLSKNADDAVILYDVESYNGKNVFNGFNATKETRTGAVVPDTTQQDGLPPKQQSVTFYSYDSKISNSGTETLKITFALYVLDEDEENQVIYDYFWWDPEIDVK